MSTRRGFLQGAVAALALRVPSFARDDHGKTESSLPPSIAKLASMKDQARPIRVEERQARHEKARRLMEANDLDAILLAEGTSLNYFTGIHWWGS